MIQRTAFKALLEHKGQLLLLGLTCVVESLSIVGQACVFGTLINNFIFLENEYNHVFGYCHYCATVSSLHSRGCGKSFGQCCESIF